MPKKVKCCVPGCGNNYKTEGPIHFYRIPKDTDIRNAYRLLLRNKCVKLDSENTRICSAHFESGLKLSRCHLPNIFPWIDEEDEKTGEKRKNLEQIASVLKTKKAKSNVLTDDQLRDRVQGYHYHVPWRFDGVPLHHGVVSSFKTLEEHEQSRAQTVNNDDIPTSLVGSNESKMNPNNNPNNSSLFQTLQELDQNRPIHTSTVDNRRDLIQRDASKYNENVHNTDLSSQSVRFHPVATVNIPYTSNMNDSLIQRKDTGQMPNISVKLGTLATPIQSLPNDNWPVRSSHAYTAPSKSISSGPSSHLSSMKSGGIQVLHVDRNFFQPGVVTSKQDNDISVRILNNSQASTVNNVDSPVESRKTSAVNTPIIKVQEQLESLQHLGNFPTRTENHTKIYKEVSSQTEVSEDDFQQMVKRMNGMRHENRNLKEEVETLRKKLQEFQNVTQCQQFDVTKLENRDLNFYTGFENLESLMMFLSIVKESAKLLPVWGKIIKERLSGDPETDRLTILGELSLFIMKMKLNLHDADLAHRFAVTENKVQSVIYTWLQIFYAFSPGSPVHQQLPESIKSGLRNFGIDWSQG